ncbi:MAG: zinc-ribbon domain-containing protein [Candidatus Aenigmatarchaeota archaeon]
MADEEDINSIKRDMEDLGARIDQLEDLQLTNKLNIIELRKEFDSFEDHIENSRNPDVSKEVKKTLEKIEKEKKGLSDWNKKFKKIDNKIRDFNKKMETMEKRLNSGSKVSGNEVTEEKTNVCEHCGMENDDGAKYCVVCGNEL